MAERTLYFDSLCGIETYAYLEDGKLTEYNSERIESGHIVGNIYKGKVTNVLNGMQAAFVNCGLERNCYISVEDLFPDHTAYDGTEIDIPKELSLNVGDEIMVQVVKAPVGKKGAKVTTNVSLVGKYMIYMPTTPFIGVSRKISDAELRRTLIMGASKQKTGNEGLIMRTAAPYAPKSEKVAELNILRKLHEAIKEKFAQAPVGKLLYTDSPLHIRVLRDLMVLDIDKVVVGNEALKESVLSVIDQNKTKLEVHDSRTDLFYDAGISAQIAQMTQPRVELENGANLMIERTEALTVIDVNTGKFTGEDSLEHTVYYTNILAAREIARQVRLRNLGGIFVVDFIDMDDANHRNALVTELEKALSTDKAKCNVLPMTKLGLVEFTRKRVNTSPLRFLSVPCKYCQGAGTMKTPDLIIYEIRAKLMDILSKGNNTVSIDLNFDIANKFAGNEELVESIRSKYPQARVYLTFHRTYRDDTANFRVENSSTITLPEGTILLY